MSISPINYRPPQNLYPTAAMTLWGPTAPRHCQHYYHNIQRRVLLSLCIFPIKLQARQTPYSILTDHRFQTFSYSSLAARHNAHTFTLS